MKKTRTRTLIFSLLLIASISSYAYLNLSPLQYQGQGEVRYEQRLLQEMEAGQLEMPDVRILKKAANLGRQILPGS
ncbi:MAG: hypothetical protein Sapg2KO_08830 [Saprospiraceae bacterium]